MNRLLRSKKIVLLLLILASISLTVTSVTMYIHYRASTESIKSALVDIVQSDKLLIETLCRMSVSKDSIISIIDDENRHRVILGRSGEIVIAELRHDSLNYICRKDIPGSGQNWTFVFDTLDVHPIKLAVRGNSGTIKCLDYSHKEVYAGYTYSPFMKWGIVAKIDSAEVDRPFYYSLLLVVAATICLVLIGSILFVKITSPMISDILESELRFRQLFESAQEGILILDAESGRIRDGNDFLAQMLGYTRGELITKTIDEVCVHNADTTSREAYENVRSENHFQIDSMNLKTKSGEHLDAEVVGNSYMVGSRRVVQCNIRDITKRKQMELALIASEERYQDLYDHAPDMFISVDTATARILQCNQTLATETGYSKEEITGRAIFELYHPDCIGDARKAFELFQEIGEVRNKELQLKRRDGTKIDVSLNVSAMRDNQGHILQSRSILRNVTELKRSEEELRRNQELFSLFMRHSPIYAFIKESTPTESRVLQASDNYEQMIGLSGRNMIGKTMQELFPPELAAKFTADDWNVVCSGDVLRLDEDLNGRNYTTIKFPIVQGKKTLLAGYTIDITDQKHAEQELLKSEQKFRTLFEKSTIGIAISEVPFETIELNPSARAMLKIFTPTVTLNQLVEVTHPEDTPREMELLQELLDGSRKSYTVVKRYVLNDGSTIWGQTLVSIVRDESGSPLYSLSFVEDITDRKRAEEGLRKNRSMLLETERIGSIGGWEFDTHTGKQIWTDGVYRIHELDTTYVPTVERGINFYAPESRPVIQQAVQRAVDLGESFDVELQIVTAKGNLRWVHVIGTADLEQQKVWGFFQDVTERRLAADALHESEIRYRQLIECSPDIIAVHSGGIFVYMNPAGLKAVGAEREEEIVGRPVLDFVHPESRQSVADRMSKVTQGTAVPMFEEKFLRLDGTSVDLEVIATPILFNNKPSGQVLARDITERKRLEKALIESEMRYRVMSEHSPTGIFVIDKDQIEYVNSALADIFGYGQGELIGVNPLELVHPTDRALTAEMLRRLMEGETSFLEYEFSGLRKNGEGRKILVFAVAITLHDRLVVQGNVLDVTDLRKNELEIQKLRQGVERSVDAIFITEPDGTIAYSNAAFEHVYGYTSEELKGKTPRILKSGMLLSREYEWFWNTLMLKQSVVWEVVNRTKDGRHITVAATNNPILDSSGRIIGFLGIHRDVTERKKIEEELKRSEAHHRRILETANEGVWAVDQNTITTFVNKRMARLLGYQPGAVLGRPMSEFLFEDDVPAHEERMALNRMGLGGAFESRFRKNDGSVLWAIVSATVLMDTNGEFEGSFAMITDITERKRAEGALHESRQRLRSLAAHLEYIREEERKHISQEFHDQLGQALTAIKMDLAMFQHAIKNTRKKLSREELLDSVHSMQGMIDRAVQSVREIMSQLRPELLDQLGLAAAIEWEAEKFQKRAGMKCTVSSNVADLQLGPGRSIAAFRIYQEAMTNVARHARATQVDTSLNFEGEELVLVIKDNGVGIDSGAESLPNSFGLIGMHERALFLEGTLEINSKKGEGTAIVLRMPLEQLRPEGGERP